MNFGLQARLNVIRFQCNRQPTVRCLVAALLCAVLLLVAQPSAAQTASRPSQGSGGSGGGNKQVVANAGGQEITAEEVEAGLNIQAAQLEEQLYQLRRQRLDALVADRLITQEAARRALTVEVLLSAEVSAKVAPVSEQEVEAFYQANQAQMRGADPATIRPQIKSYLFNQRLNAQRETFVQGLRAQSKVVINLPLPRLRLRAASKGAPFKGGVNAPVTIIEFSDFHCPFCVKAQATLTQVLARYGDKVKLVYRDLPLEQLHPQARRAAEAARCADEQGKFWPYHDKLYANGTDTSTEKLKALAQAVELDVAAFESCLLSGKQQAAIQQSVEEATQLGLNGTPAFLINGRYFSGAQPLETFVRVIEEELAQRQAEAAVKPATVPPPPER